MTKLEKKIRRLKENPKGISSNELSKLLLSLGFVERAGKGSHKCFKHPEIPGAPLIVPFQNPLLKTYVKKAYNVIQQLIDRYDDE